MDADAGAGRDDANAAAAASAPRGLFGRGRLPSDTSPTWELELLISGAVLFALFQAPPAVDELFARFQARLSRGLLETAIFVALYVKAILYALIAAFVVHLGGRAYWVALLGLRSVFPAGVDWSRFGYGPATRDVYRRRLPKLEDQLFHVDPRTGAHGVLAHLPVDHLPRGRHLLTVRPAPRADPERRDEPLEPYAIPFWT